MREIKFRGKRIDTGEWVYGDYRRAQFQCDDDVWEELSYIYLEEQDYMVFYKVDPKTAGQYTGLKDNNGVDIYEGDILKCIENYEVLWEKNEACWEAWNLERSNCIAPRVWGEQEVVGNKYENPDIMAKNALKRNVNIGDNSDGY